MSKQLDFLNSLPEQGGAKIYTQLTDLQHHTIPGEIGIVGSAAVAYHAKANNLDQGQLTTDAYERLGLQQVPNTSLGDLDTVTKSLESVRPSVTQHFWWAHRHTPRNVEEGVQPRHYGALVHKNSEGLSPKPDVDIFTWHQELDTFTEVPYDNISDLKLLIADAAGQLAATIGEMWRVTWNRPRNDQSAAPINPKQFGHVAVLRQITDRAEVEHRWRARHPSLDEGAYETLQNIERAVARQEITLRQPNKTRVRLAKHLLPGCVEQRCASDTDYPITSTLGIICRKAVNYAKR